MSHSLVLPGTPLTWTVSPALRAMQRAPAHESTVLHALLWAAWSTCHNQPGACGTLAPSCSRWRGRLFGALLHTLPGPLLVHRAAYTAPARHVTAPPHTTFDTTPQHGTWATRPQPGQHHTDHKGPPQASAPPTRTLPLRCPQPPKWWMPRTGCGGYKSTSKRNRCVSPLTALATPVSNHQPSHSTAGQHMQQSSACPPTAVPALHKAAMPPPGRCKMLLLPRSSRDVREGRVHVQNSRASRLPPAELAVSAAAACLLRPRLQHCPCSLLLSGTCWRQTRGWACPGRALGALCR